MHVFFSSLGKELCKTLREDLPFHYDQIDHEYHYVRIDIALVGKSNQMMLCSNANQVYIIVIKCECIN